MPIQVNSSGVSHAKRLVRNNDIDFSSSWGFSAEDGTALLGENEDWRNYGWFHLAVDTDETNNTKGYWKYPYGKNGKIYRRGVIAAKSRAAAEGETGIANAADGLLQMIDKKQEAKSLLQKALDLLFGREDVTPVINNDNGFIIQKELDGTSRWFAWVTNQWEDREGHIITDSAHREFEAWLNENPQFAPQLWIWHTPGTAKENRADWWIYSDGFFMYSGVLALEEAQAYENLENVDVGMSHGFYVLRYDFEKRHILKYRTFEVSELPRDRAANPFTNFSFIKEAQEKMFDDPIKRQYLVERLGDTKVTELEQDTEGRKKALEILGVSMKELETQIAEKETAKFEERVVAAVTKATEARTKAIVEQIVKAMNPEGLQATIVNIQEQLVAHDALVKQIADLQDAVEHLKETEDARISAAITPSMPFLWGSSVQNTKETPEEIEDELSDVLKEQAKQITNQSDYSWLGHVSLSPGG